MALKIWAYGVNGHWTGQSVNWADTGNWIEGAVPQPGDVDVITAGQVVATSAALDWQAIYVQSETGKSNASLTLDNTNLPAGSTIILEGIGSGAGLTLHNSEINGNILATYGPAGITVAPNSTASNNGYMIVSGWTRSSLSLLDYGSFSNNGAIGAGKNGSFSMVLSHDEFNAGTFVAANGGSVTFSSGAYTLPTFNTLNNNGKLVVANGTMSIGANVKQSDQGEIDVNGGTLTFQGHTDGGTINIESGMLNFTPTPQAPGPLSALYLNSAVDFSGPSATLNFNQTLQAINFRPAMDDLLVTIPWADGGYQVADIHLTGHAYSAAGFSVSGNTVVYTAHPVS